MTKNEKVDMLYYEIAFLFCYILVERCKWWEGLMAWTVLMERWTFLQSLFIKRHKVFFFAGCVLTVEIPLLLYSTFFIPFTPSLPSSNHSVFMIFFKLHCFESCHFSSGAERPLSRWHCLWRFSLFSSVVWRLISFSFDFRSFSQTVFI